MTKTLVIRDGIGYVEHEGPTGCSLTSATPADYVAEIERLGAALKAANANHEHFEREWYLRGDEIEGLIHDNARLMESLNGEVNESERLRALLGSHPERARLCHDGHPPIVHFDQCPLCREDV